MSVSEGGGFNFLWLGLLGGAAWLAYEYYQNQSNALVNSVIPQPTTIVPTDSVHVSTNGGTGYAVTPVVTSAIANAIISTATANQGSQGSPPRYDPSGNLLQSATLWSAYLREYTNTSANFAQYFSNPNQQINFADFMQVINASGALGLSGMRGSGIGTIGLSTTPARILYSPLQLANAKSQRYSRY